MMTMVIAIDSNEINNMEMLSERFQTPSNQYKIERWR